MPDLAIQYARFWFQPVGLRVKKGVLPAVQSRDTVKGSGLLADLGEFWLYLFKANPLRIILLVMLMITAAIMEMATLAAVVPLMGALMDSQNPDGSFLSDSHLLPPFVTSAENPYELILFAVIVIVCVAALVRILVIRKTAEFSASVGVDIQTLYFRKLLNLDYESVINQSSSQNISLITNKIQIVITNYILGVLTSLTSIVSACGVIVVLLIVSTPVVFVALGLLVCAYLLIAWLTRKKLKAYGRDLQVYIPQKVRCVQEALGGIRDVSMSGSQEVFVDRLGHVATKVENAGAKLNFYNAFPRPLLEAAGISSIAVIAWLAHKGFYTGDDLLPVLGVFALGMLRLLPYVQQVFGQWTRLFNGQLILAELLTALRQPDKSPTEASVGKERMAFEDAIDLVDVGFTYQGVDTPVFQGLNCTLTKGEYIGIVGPTGSGKSTLVDILMGLLPPSDGVVQIDGVPLDAVNRAQWRKSVAHVPQKIFLSQGSLASNIAFSIEPDAVDEDWMVRCAEVACIDEFITSLPAAYQTQVGEDGVRLSGGQRQRIGIARALYARCSVLVFDEATNALDPATERAVMNNIRSLKDQCTIIAVTHDLDSVKYCGRVLKIDAGSAQWV